MLCMRLVKFSCPLKWRAVSKIRVDVVEVHEVTIRCEDMTNQSFNGCELPDTFRYAADQADFIAYHVVTPIYFSIGLLGHLLVLFGFYRQTKKEPAYVYQVFLTISETVEIVVFTLYALTCKIWSKDDGSGAPWFVSSKILMQFSAHGAVPLVNVLITCSLLLAMAMAADRFYALWRPVSYPKVAQSRYRYLVLALCAIISVTTSIFDAFRFYTVQNVGRYFRKVDMVYVASGTGKVLANIRNGLRLIALGSLVFFNVAVVNLYRNRCKSKDILKNSLSKFRAQYRERTLIALAVVQLLTTDFVILPQTTYFVLVYAEPTFTTCEGALVGAVADAMLQLAEMANFWLSIVFSNHLRQAMTSVWRRRGNRVFNGDRAVERSQAKVKR